MVAAAAVPPALSAVGCSSPVQHIVKHQHCSDQALHGYSRSEAFLLLSMVQASQQEWTCNACAECDQLMSPVSSDPTPHQRRVCI